MCARVHLDLLLSDDGRRTAAEPTGRLKIIPADEYVFEALQAGASGFLQPAIASTRSAAVIC
ncbi:hypothetical protein [Nonomuraea sp. NPDC052265]|uniref:hypothetical protein n=1 Tax=Nonomuraea sp. NPDC052265 TaxID=3364374 RepID=UPI0037CB1A16